MFKVPKYLGCGQILPATFCIHVVFGVSVERDERPTNNHSLLSSAPREGLSECISLSSSAVQRPRGVVVEVLNLFFSLF
jgi:hypothetical protein